MTDAALDPGEAIQRAIYATLTADPRLIALFGGETPRVWDHVRRDEAGKAEGGYPYIQIGEDQIIGGEATPQVDESEVIADVHIWDEPGDGSGKELSKKISAAIREALVGAERFDDFAEAVAEHGFICVLGERRDARHLNPADGLTEHAVLTFRFELDPQPGL